MAYQHMKDSWCHKSFIHLTSVTTVHIAQIYLVLLVPELYQLVLRAYTAVPEAKYSTHKYN